MLSTGRGEKGHFVDGGVVANNPTIAGMSFLQRIHPRSDAANTAVLSLGCGSCWSSSGLPPAGGKLLVASPMIDIMLGASCDTSVAAGEMLFRTVRGLGQCNGPIWLCLLDFTCLIINSNFLTLHRICC
jgi:hypothetical protein